MKKGRNKIFRYKFLLPILFFIHCPGAVVEKGGIVRDPGFLASATILRSDKPKILKRAEGESSTFFLLGLFPVTTPVNIEYALSQAVQSVDDGDTIINVHIWHETHYFFPLGTVSVCKVEGDVVSLKQDLPLFEDPRSRNSDGGISVGGKRK